VTRWSERNRFEIEPHGDVESYPTTPNTEELDTLVRRFDKLVHWTEAVNAAFTRTRGFLEVPELAATGRAFRPSA
jgi:hypothetical protein